MPAIRARRVMIFGRGPPGGVGVVHRSRPAATIRFGHPPPAPGCRPRGRCQGRAAAALRTPCTRQARPPGRRPWQAGGSNRPGPLPKAGRAPVAARVRSSARSRSPELSAISARRPRTSSLCRRWLSRSSYTHSSSRSARSSPWQSVAASSSSSRETSSSNARRSIESSGPGSIPTRSRVAVMMSAAAGPSSRLNVASVVRRLDRALSSSTSGQNTEATRRRGWRPG